MKTYLNETLRNSKEYDWKETKMIKKILRVTSIIIAIFVFILICMHIDVTLGRKMEAGKNMPTEYAPHYSDFQLYVEGNHYMSSYLKILKKRKAPSTLISSFCRMIKVVILF